jgi:zinc transport system permease protein
MFEIFQYSFMIRALLAGVLVAVSLPILGSFLVARRYSLIADSLAHVSLAGIGAGLLLQVSPIFVALPVAVAGAIAIEYLRQHGKLSGDTSLAVLMSAGLALAVVLSGLSGGRTDFNTFLFGSIATTTKADVWILFGAVASMLCILAKYYRSFLHISFDEDSAKIAGYNVAFLNYLLVIMTACIVVLCLRIVGGLLISALLVIPVVTGGGLARSFASSIIISVCSAIISVLTGLFLSFYVGIAAGGAIVLVTLAIFIISILFRK